MFGDSQGCILEISPLKFALLIDAEGAAILSKKIVGKADVDIAAMIDRLGSADWVRQGLSHLAETEGKCPFCQQSTPHSLQADLEAYFDEQYIGDMKSVEELTAAYDQETALVRRQLEHLLSTTPEYLDVESLRRQCELFDLLVRGNLEKLQAKNDEPSQPVILDKLGDVARAIEELIEAANTAIQAHNLLIQQRETETKSLEAEVWRLFLDSGLSACISDFQSKKDNIDKALDGLSKRTGEVARA